MATATSSGSGKVTVPVSEVTEFVRKEVGLPSSFFVAISKSRILADGSMEANYTFDNSGQPPPPATVELSEGTPA
jgi:hypothetical protein